MLRVRSKETGRKASSVTPVNTRKCSENRTENLKRMKKIASEKSNYGIAQIKEEFFTRPRAGKIKDERVLAGKRVLQRIYEKA